MKQLIWIAFAVGMLGWHTACAQHLDITATKVEWASKLNHWSGVKQGTGPGGIYGTPPDSMLCNFVIDFQKKSITVTQVSTGKVKYAVNFLMVYQGANRSVSLQPNETLFILGDPQMNVITYDENTGTMGFVFHDKRIHLFGRFSPKA